MIPIDNYIILNESGNTYFGAVASKFAYRLTIPEVFKLEPSEKYFVFEVMPDESVLLRAAQPTMSTAAAYMGENRVMVWREA